MKLVNAEMLDGAAEAAEKLKDLNAAIHCLMWLSDENPIGFANSTTNEELVERIMPMPERESLWDLALKLEQIRSIAYGESIEWDMIARELDDAAAEECVQHQRRTERDFNTMREALETPGMGCLVVADRIKKGEYKIVKTTHETD